MATNAMLLKMLFYSRDAVLAKRWKLTSGFRVEAGYNLAQWIYQCDPNTCIYSRVTTDNDRYVPTVMAMRACVCVYIRSHVWLSLGFVCLGFMPTVSKRSRPNLACTLIVQMWCCRTCCRGDVWLARRCTISLSTILNLSQLISTTCHSLNLWRRWRRTIKS